MFKIKTCILLLIINGSILNAQALHFTESDIKTCCEESINHFIETGCNKDLLSGNIYLDYEPLGNSIDLEKIKRVKLSVLDQYIIRKNKYHNNNLISLNYYLLGDNLIISIRLYFLRSFMNGDKPISGRYYCYSLHNKTWTLDSTSVNSILQENNQIEETLISSLVSLNDIRFNNRNNTFIYIQSQHPFINKASVPFPVINLNTKFKYLSKDIRKKVRKGITILEPGALIDSDTLYTYIRPVRVTYQKRAFKMKVFNETYIWLYTLSDDRKRWLLKKRVVNDFWNYSF